MAKFVSSLLLVAAALFFVVVGIQGLSSSSECAEESFWCRTSVDCCGTAVCWPHMVGSAWTVCRSWYQLDEGTYPITFPFPWIRTDPYRDGVVKPRKPLEISSSSRIIEPRVPKVMPKGRIFGKFG